MPRPSLRTSQRKFAHENDPEIGYAFLQTGTRERQQAQEVTRALLREIIPGGKTQPHSFRDLKVSQEDASGSHKEKGGGLNDRKSGRGTTKKDKKAEFHGRRKSSTASAALLPEEYRESSPLSEFLPNILPESETQKDTEVTPEEMERTRIRDILSSMGYPENGESGPSPLTLFCLPKGLDSVPPGTGTQKEMGASSGSSSHRLQGKVGKLRVHASGAVRLCLGSSSTFDVAGHVSTMAKRVLSIIHGEEGNMATAGVEPRNVHERNTPLQPREEKIAPNQCVDLGPVFSTFQILPQGVGGKG